MEDRDFGPEDIIFTNNEPKLVYIIKGSVDLTLGKFKNFKFLKTFY